MFESYLFKYFFNLAMIIFSFYYFIIIRLIFNLIMLFIVSFKIHFFHIMISFCYKLVFMPQFLFFIIILYLNHCIISIILEFNHFLILFLIINFHILIFYFIIFILFF